MGADEWVTSTTVWKVLGGMLHHSGGHRPTNNASVRRPALHFLIHQERDRMQHFARSRVSTSKHPC
jgi:hypothetical protein